MTELREKDLLEQLANAHEIADSFKRIAELRGDMLKSYNISVKTLEEKIVAVNISNQLLKESNQILEKKIIELQGAIKNGKL